MSPAKEVSANAGLLSFYVLSYRMNKNIILAVALLLAGCGGSSPPPPPPLNITVNMNPSSWVFQYSPNMPTNPTGNSSGWEFDFPSVDGVHYLVFPATGKLSGTVHMSFDIQAQDSTRFIEKEPCDGSYAAVRLFFQQRGDQLTAAEEFKRWWSAPTRLAPGTYAISYTLDPSLWSSVFGKYGNVSAEATTGFNQALSDIQAVGMTFGGCFAGHGVFTDGQAKFLAKSYTVN